MKQEFGRFFIITWIWIGSPSQSVLALSTSTSSNSQSYQQHNNVHDELKGKMVLAPLTRGGNLPFRRLCADFGMEVSLSEMIYARSLLKGDAVEQARLRRATNEKYFGVQFATNNVEEGCKAIEMAAGAGADFCDLNCGCPIFEATRRGLG
jgi:tRNA-dihydrouridine synthase 3